MKAKKKARKPRVWKCWAVIGPDAMFPCIAGLTRAMAEALSEPDERVLRLEVREVLK